MHTWLGSPDGDGFEHEQIVVQPQFLTLADGRRLAWREYGDPLGVPCIYTTGTPASSLAGAVYDEAARRGGVRWISTDKPGSGLSDYQPGRRLLDWPDDVGALAAQLGLLRFAVAGESGGGPHVLALGRGMASKLTTVVVLAGMGPGHEPWVRRGMTRQNRLMLGMAQRAPWALWPATAIMGWQLKTPRRAQRALSRLMKAAPPADRELLQSSPELAAVLISATRDAFRQGPRGAAQELSLFARPWGFDLTEIRAHVDLWHGTEDANVPIAVARAVVDRLPDCRPRFVTGAGHTVAWTRLDEIMNVIRAAA